MKKRAIVRGLVFAALLGIFLYGFFSYQRLAALIDRQSSFKGWTFPSQVYSAPLTLKPDAAIFMEDVVAHLKMASYVQIFSGEPATEGPMPNTTGRFGIRLPALGQFRIENKKMVLSRPPMDYPGKSGFGNTFEIIFSKSGIDRITDLSSGLRQESLSLDPVLLGTFSQTFEARKWKRLDELPAHLPKAVLAIEDRRFYSHHGVDPRGLARAMWKNIRARRVVEGGSTLTQQLAKNLFLTRKRTLRRKLAEMVLAVLMESRYSKNEILELYLNQIYLGQRGPVGVYGVEEGAQLYFGKSVSDLTPGESAILAGLIHAPNVYAPAQNSEPVLERRATVLNRMLDEGFITTEERRQALLEPLQVLPPDKKPYRRAPYFLAYVHDLLSERYQPFVLNSRGLTVFTTLDARLQKIAEVAAARSEFQSALVAMDPRTGDILAMVGGTNFSASQFNRAVQAERQPGSAFKPFVLAAALEHGYTLAWREDDTPLVLADHGVVWSPQNFDQQFRGPVTVREILTHSLNIPTVRLARRVGLEEVVSMAQRLGITSALMPVPSLALGSMEVTLLDLTHAYSAFANLGEEPAIRPIVLIRDRDGVVLEDHGALHGSVLSPQTAFLVNDVLQSVMKEGTAKSVKNLGFEKTAAGKTGTNVDYRDAWFIGYTPNLLCGVWVGHDQPRSLKYAASQLALPIWAEFMTRALDREADLPFPDVPGIVEAKVDLETGDLARSGCPLIRKEFFTNETVPRVKCRLHAGGVEGWFKKLFG